MYRDAVAGWGEAQTERDRQTEQVLSGGGIQLGGGRGIHDPFFFIGGFSQGLALQETDDFFIGVAKDRYRPMPFEPVQGLAGKGGVDQGIAAVDDMVEVFVGKKSLNCGQGRKVAVDVGEQEDVHNGAMTLSGWRRYSEVSVDSRNSHPQVRVNSMIPGDYQLCSKKTMEKPPPFSVWSVADISCGICHFGNT